MNPKHILVIAFLHLFSPFLLWGENDFRVTSLEVVLPDELIVTFSRAADVEFASFTVDNGVGEAVDYVLNYSKTELHLQFEHHFKSGKLHTLTLDGVYAQEPGLILLDDVFTFDVPDIVATSDIRINEIMFDAPHGSCEYVEVMNVSNKNLDLSNYRITTRTEAGVLNSGNIFPNNTIITPQGYVALCRDSNVVLTHHSCPDTAVVRSCTWGLTLHNTTKTIYLTSPDREIIYDSVTYHSTWHTSPLAFSKGVALERISPYLPALDASSWHSASVANNYGTPGYANSMGDTIPPLPPQPELELGGIVFNEVMFHAPFNSCEYVEVANLTSEAINLGGLRISKRNTDGEFTAGYMFPTCTIAPQAYLALCADADVVAHHHNSLYDAHIESADWSQNLNNDSSSLYLISANGRILYDSLMYQAAWHHPLVKNPEGVALEKIHPSLPSYSQSSWHSASSDSHYGTPGDVNSQYRDPEMGYAHDDFAYLDPEAFSPDGDGYEDLCFIRYQMPSEGYMANVYVFTPSGLRLQQIAENSLLATEGYFVWDGTTQAGLNANVGVYVLIFEAFNSTNGKRLRCKLPIVVSGR